MYIYIYIYIYLIAKLELSLIFGQTNYTVIKFKPLCQQQTFHLDFITIKRENVGNCKLLACDGKVLLSQQLEPKSKNVLLDPEQPKTNMVQNM